MSPVQQTIAPLLWFLSAVLKHVQASGRSRDALSDQTQSAKNSFTGDPPHFQTEAGANAHWAACTKPGTRTTRLGCGNKPRTHLRLGGGDLKRAENNRETHRCQVQELLFHSAVCCSYFFLTEMFLTWRAGCGCYQVVIGGKPVLPDDRTNSLNLGHLNGSAPGGGSHRTAEDIPASLTRVLNVETAAKQLTNRHSARTSTTACRLNEKPRRNKQTSAERNLRALCHL